MTHKSKILLIRPPAVAFKRRPAPMVSEPLGLMYLASYLKKHGKNVEIIDSFIGNERSREGDFHNVGIPFKKLKRKIEEFSPDIVGISCMYTQYSKGAREVARITKEVSKNILVIAGGAHASVFYEVILQDSNIDLIVKGEGEEALLEIANKHEEGKNINEIPNTAVKSGENVKLNTCRPLIKDLSSIPFPDRELLDMDSYFNQKYSSERAMKYPRLSMITSRGCPFKCVFCSIHSVWHHSFRARPAMDVVDEIELLYSRYGVKEIMFYDDNMTLDKGRMNRICDEIIKRNIKIRWSTPNGVAIWTLDKPTVKNMKRAGCYKITFGLETGCSATRKFIGKGFIDPEKAIDLIRFCNKIGLWTISSFIIGFPHEKKGDILETLSFAIRSDVDMATFYSACAYPGTELYEICKKEGLVKDAFSHSGLEWIGDATSGASMDTRYLMKKDIDFLTMDLKKKFLKKRIVSFLNPMRVLRKLNGPDEVKYLFRMLKIYSNALKASLKSNQK